MSILNWFKNTQQVIFPKIVIAFSSSGCMGHINKFQWLGVIQSTEGEIHKVRVIISETQDSRDRDIKEEIAYQIQHLGLNIYVHYI